MDWFHAFWVWWGFLMLSKTTKVVCPCYEYCENSRYNIFIFFRRKKLDRLIFPKTLHFEKRQKSLSPRNKKTFENIIPPVIKRKFTNKEDKHLSVFMLNNLTRRQHISSTAQVEWPDSTSFPIQILPNKITKSGHSLFAATAAAAARSQAAGEALAIAAGTGHNTGRATRFSQFCHQIPYKFH